MFRPGFMPSVNRVKRRGKTMCFKTYPRVFVGDKVQMEWKAGELVPVPMKAQLFYSYQSANEAGQMGHAQEVVYALAEKQGFTVEQSIPQTLYDGWEFRIECMRKPRLPAYITYRAGQHRDE